MKLVAMHSVEMNNHVRNTYFSTRINESLLLEHRNAFQMVEFCFANTKEKQIQLISCTIFF